MLVYKNKNDLKWLYVVITRNNPFLFLSWDRNNNYKCILCEALDTHLWTSSNVYYGFQNQDGSPVSLPACSALSTEHLLRHSNFSFYDFS